MLHVPFVLLGHLSALAPRLEWVVAVIILPQRQAVLVAKQAAEVDVLTGGRFRLGVGVGWNAVEFIGLNERFEEQIEVLRAPWTSEVIDFHGTYHTIPEAGINPLPVQRPIPLWIGGTAEVIMARIGRLADGWFPRHQPGERLMSDLAIIAEHARATGRDPASVGMEGRFLHRAERRGALGRADRILARGRRHTCVHQNYGRGTRPQGPHRDGPALRGDGGPALARDTILDHAGVRTHLPGGTGGAHVRHVRGVGRACCHEASCPEPVAYARLSGGERRLTISHLSATLDLSQDRERSRERSQTQCHLPHRLPIVGDRSSGAPDF